MLLVQMKEIVYGAYIYNILDQKFLENKVLLPWIGRRIGCSSEGWLVTLDNKFGVILFKPFLVSEGNDHIIHLPPLFPLPGTAGYIQLMILNLTFSRLRHLHRIL